VNATGLESGNDLVTALGDIPWLQDNALTDVWGAWEVTYRDVVILNAENQPVGVFNLTEHDLAVPGEFAALEALLLDAVE